MQKSLKESINDAMGVTGAISAASALLIVVIALATVYSRNSFVDGIFAVFVTSSFVWLCLFIYKNQNDEPTK